jgi:two-component system response regulator (stage 0 sporulation protein A)
MTDMERKINLLIDAVASEDEQTRASAVAELRQMLSDSTPSIVPSSTTLEATIDRHLTRLGIPHNIQGYRLLRTAIRLVIEDEELIDSMVKVLYPRVAELHHTTKPRAERVIRHAVELAFMRADPKILYDYFGGTINPNKGKPTNSEFISMVAYRIKLMMGER